MDSWIAAANITALYCLGAGDQTGHIQRKGCFRIDQADGNNRPATMHRPICRLKSFNRASGVRKGDIGRDIHKLIYEKSPYIFLYRLDKIMAYRKEIKTDGEIVPKYFFTHIGDWYFTD